MGVYSDICRSSVGFRRLPRLTFLSLNLKYVRYIGMLRELEIHLDTDCSREEMLVICVATTFQCLPIHIRRHNNISNLVTIQKILLVD